jgi:hypothetical protein
MEKKSEKLEDLKNKILKLLKSYGMTITFDDKSEIKLIFYPGESEKLHHINEQLSARKSDPPWSYFEELHKKEYMKVATPATEALINIHNGEKAFQNEETDKVIEFYIKADNYFEEMKIKIKNADKRLENGASKKGKTKADIKEVCEFLKEKIESPNHLNLKRNDDAKYGRSASALAAKKFNISQRTVLIYWSKRKEYFKK